MKIFILIVLNAFLFTPCIAQTIGDNYYPRAFFSFQNYEDDKFTVFFKGTESHVQISPILLDEKLTLSFAEATNKGEWGKTALSEGTAYAVPVQMKVFSMTQEQAQAFLQSTWEAQKVLGFDEDYYGSKARIVGFYGIPHDDSFVEALLDGKIDIAYKGFGNDFPYVINGMFDKQSIVSAGPGNGGGGVFHQDGFTEKQKEILKQHAFQFVTFRHGLQGIEIDPESSELIYWKAMVPDSEHIRKIRRRIPMYYQGATATLPKMRVIQPPTKEATVGENRFTPYEIKSLSNVAIPTQKTGNEAWSYYVENMKAITEEILMGEFEVDTTGSFYEMNDRSQNGIMYIIGPGNGGGGAFKK